METMKDVYIEMPKSGATGGGARRRRWPRLLKYSVIVVYMLFTFGAALAIFGMAAETRSTLAGAKVAFTNVNTMYEQVRRLADLVCAIPESGWPPELVDLLDTMCHRVQT